MEIDMKTTSYALRTIRNTNVFTYETLERAKQEKVRFEKRIGRPLIIVKITHQEELLD